MSTSETKGNSVLLDETTAWREDFVPFLEPKENSPSLYAKDYIKRDRQTYHSLIIRHVLSVKGKGFTPVILPCAHYPRYYSTHVEGVVVLGTDDTAYDRAVEIGMALLCEFNHIDTKADQEVLARIEAEQSKVLVRLFQSFPSPLTSIPPPIN
jgi:hypothetical protein